MPRSGRWNILGYVLAFMAGAPLQIVTMQLKLGLTGGTFKTNVWLFFLTSTAACVVWLYSQHLLQHEQLAIHERELAALRLLDGE